MTRLRHGPWGGGGWRRRRRVLAVVCLAVMPCGAPADVKESEVKAAFLLNFTRFVDWPPTAFESADSPLTICIRGDDPFAATLAHLVERQLAKARKLPAVRTRRSPPAGKC